MNRRKLLRVLPLAAMAGVTVKVGETAAMAYEMKPDKKYLFVIPGAPARSTAYAAEHLRQRGINATVIGGADDLKIYELE